MQSSISCPVITIDGPSGTGKGTICHMLANHLNWHVLDSGCIYRVLAYAVRKRGIALSDIKNIIQVAHTLDVRFETDPHLKSAVFLDGINVINAIRSEIFGQDASKIAVIPEVRQALLARQRAFAKSPGLVTDGRDMGTVVFPDAILKIYLDASTAIRAERRYFQLKDKGIDVSLAEVEKELIERDERDAKRSCSPLHAAANATIINTDGLDVAQVFNLVLKLYNECV